VEFRVLGPVEVWVGGASVELGGAKARAVLATLLLAEGRVVPAETLIDVLWPDQPPDSATALIRTYVSILRKRLAESGVESVVIRTHAPGYVADIDPAGLDSRRFEDLVAQARVRTAEGDRVGAGQAYRSALALWRGAALGGVGDALRTDAARLEDLRMSVLEERIAVDLALGREAVLVAEVRALWSENPMHERLLGYLMTVLYRLGRQSEALAAFEDGRRMLADELGVDPGPELQAVYEAVLRADHSVLGRDEVPPEPDERTPVAQLPPTVADFTGRTAEVGGLLAALRPPGPGVPLCVLSGPAGGGKSALAVHVAHQLAEAFPDGQVYVELRGMSDEPAAPEDVLRRLLRDFGAEAPGQPAGLEELSARYRSLLAGRRVLIVLDDAADERQVRSLLPGSPGSAVLVTARNRLAGLAGATFTQLSVLSRGEATELLTRIIGTERVGREPDVASRITALCGQLPLAIRIARARLTTRPGWSLTLMAHRLDDERRRLDELAVGDQEVRAGIELSYRSLAAPAARALRLLGVLGLPTFCATTLAVLLDVPLRESEVVIELLIDAQFVQYSGPDELGRMTYRVHDLVRVFGRERAQVDDRPEDRAAAVHRVLGGWLWLIAEIARVAPSGTISGRDTYQQVRPLDPELAEPFRTDPRAWFAAEHDNFVVGVERAAALDLAALAGELASALSGSVFIVSNRLEAWSRTLTAAIAAARRAEDTHGEALLLVELGELKYAEDRFDEARECLSQALEIFRVLGDRQGEMSALASLGAAVREVGAFAEALVILDEAYRTAVELGDDAGIGQVTRLRGAVRLETGDYGYASADLQESLAAFRRAGSRRGEGLTLRAISVLHRALGEFALAEEEAGQALAIFRAVGDELLTVFGVQAWAKARIRQGKLAGLDDDLTTVLAASRRQGDRFGSALVLRTLGEFHLAAGSLDAARDCFAESIELWESLGLKLFRARTQRGVADLHEAEGDLVAAEAVRAEAVEVFRAYGAREADELQPLSSLSPPWSHRVR
jgi:DNA-binding SARP family transcriptional activator/tetratricopeptide (TPR) repeat protein